jgi:exopolysaccharide production protein ExoY
MQQIEYNNQPSPILLLQATLKNLILHRPLKRIFDISFSLVVLVLGAPLFLFIALFIRLNSSGKIVYSQERIGRGGKPFRCYKFRTMYADADERLSRLLKSSPKLKREWEATHKLKIDPRVTSVGLFLRKTSLDELPQFWNVLLGDLSVVGPRPVVQAEIIKHFREKAHVVLRVRPGLTGLWQVSGRSDTTYEKRISLDEKYIQEQTFLLDVKIILKTIPAMISAKGAY